MSSVRSGDLLPAPEPQRLGQWRADRPAMLVICRASVGASVQLPTVVSLPMPLAVETPHAVARRSSNGTLLVADYVREVQGDTALVRITTDSPDVQLEYYQDLQRQAEGRGFFYVWPGLVDVGDFSFEVQLPAGASDARVSPPPVRQEQGDEGRMLYFGDLGPLAKGRSGTVRVNYARAVGTLGTVQADALVSATSDATSRDGASGPAWVWVVLGLAVVLFAGSIVVFLRSGRKASS